MDASRDWSRRSIGELNRRLKLAGAFGHLGIARDDSSTRFGNLQDLEFSRIDDEARTLRDRELNAKVVSAL